MSTDSSHRERFVVEAREHLAGITPALMALERGDGDSRVHFEQVLRSVHSIKGGAGFTGHHTVEQLAHAMETVVENIRDGHLPPNTDVIDAILSGIDRISAMIDDLDHSDAADISQLLGRLDSLTRTQGSPSSTSAAKVIATSVSAIPMTPLTKASVQPGEFPISDRVLAAWQRDGFLYGVKLDWFACERDCNLPPLEVARRLEQAGAVLDSRLDITGPSLEDGLSSPPLWYRAIISSSLGSEQFAQQLAIPCAAIVRLERVDSAPHHETRATAEPVQRTTPAATSLRIPVPLIDRMMGLAGELVLVRNQAMQSADPAFVQMRQLLRRLDSVTKDLQDAALRMRMQPVGTLFDRFPRLVRDVARQIGKRIEMEITGSEVELDKTIIEVLSDPLTHLVRNCCDHGIEPPDVRTRAGKSATGVIRLSASQERGRILIRIRDDGRGLDRDAIKRKALERRVKPAEELNKLSDRQVYDLILLSGFSTAAKVTDLSGRGVGMDVVKTNLEQIGGVLEIDSTPGMGTTFTLSLPLTLAIVPCLLIRSRRERYALPLRDVEMIVHLDTGERRVRIECSHDEEVVRLRDRLLPVTRLDEVLSRRRPFTEETRAAIIAEHHPSRQEPERQYVAVLKIGSERCGLVIEELLGTEEIVVKPLHPLLRPLTVYGGSTILGDGRVAMILSGEGIARHSGVAFRSMERDTPTLLGEDQNQYREAMLLFRSGPNELFALQLSTVRRVVRIRYEQIERVGEREMINIDGKAINILRLDRLAGVSLCPERSSLYLILPRNNNAIGMLASEIVDTPTLPPNLDTEAYRADGILGSMLIHDQIALFLDMDRLIVMWQNATPGSQPALPGGARKRILVIDDTQFFRQLVKSQLENAGHDVVVAPNGSDGLAELDKARFDLVVSDIEMPVMDGLTFARRVREKPNFAELPLLALTTLSGNEDRQRASDSGFDAYQVKLDRQQFLACVGALLEHGRSTAIVTGSAAG